MNRDWWHWFIVTLNLPTSSTGCIEYARALDVSVFDSLRKFAYFSLLQNYVLNAVGESFNIFDYNESMN